MPPDAATIETWHRDPAREDAMGPAHLPVWRHFIETVPERDLSTRSVLDFGCNQGGFLRTLYAIRPFRFGLGVDIAAASVARAEADKAGLPVRYEVATDLAAHPGRFDIAFSHEVIYLVPDIAEHARQMFAALRDGGVYYAVTGCHADSPLWPRWKEILARTTNVPTQDRTVADYGDAFRTAGFRVAIRRFGFTGFMPLDGYSEYYPTIDDRLRYAAEIKMLFRLEKAA